MVERLVRIIILAVRLFHRSQVRAEIALLPHHPPASLGIIIFSANVCPLRRRVATYAEGRCSTLVIICLEVTNFAVNKEDLKLASHPVEWQHMVVPPCVGFPLPCYLAGAVNHPWGHGPFIAGLAEEMPNLVRSLSDNPHLFRPVPPSIVHVSIKRLKEDGLVQWVGQNHNRADDSKQTFLSQPSPGEGCRRNQCDDKSGNEDDVGGDQQ